MCYSLEVDSASYILIALQDRGQPLIIKASSHRAYGSDVLTSVNSIAYLQWDQDYRQTLSYCFAVAFGKSPVLKSEFA